MALSKEWYDAEFFDSESETLHRAPSIEYSFYNAVKTGDMEYVIKNCKEDAFIHLEGTGVLSRNTLQSVKCRSYLPSTGTWFTVLHRKMLKKISKVFRPCGPLAKTWRGC